jgi:hypothetical protein
MVIDSYDSFIEVWTESVKEARIYKPTITKCSLR